MFYVNPWVSRYNEGKYHTSKKLNWLRKRQKKLGGKVKVETVTKRFGAQPLSLFHPEHPAAKFGMDSVEYKNRDRSKWA